MNNLTTQKNVKIVKNCVLLGAICLFCAWLGFGLCASMTANMLSDVDVKSNDANWHNSEAGERVSLGIASVNDKLYCIANGANPYDVGYYTEWRNTQSGVNISLGVATPEDYDFVIACGANPAEFVV